MTIAIPAGREVALELARALADRARCRRSRVGAVIVDVHGEVVAIGNNGTVTGLACTAGGCPRGLLGYIEAPADTPSEGKAKCVGIHAEAAALVWAARNGRAVRGGTLYTTKTPCRTCTMLINQAGIAMTVVDES